MLLSIEIVATLLSLQLTFFRLLDTEQSYTEEKKTAETPKIIVF